MGVLLKGQLAGAGKTKLVSTVVENLLKTLTEHPNDEALAYFYCDRNQADHRDPEHILASLVRQLVSIAKDDRSVQRLISQLYDQERRSGFASGKLKYDQIQSLLEQLVGTYPQVTIVVDALDECDRLTRVKLIDTLDRLVDKSPGLLKVFISSRPERDIKYRFGVGPNLEIRATDNQEDIEMFVEESLAQSPQDWQECIKAPLRAAIRETLLGRNEGMWVDRITVSWYQLILLQVSMGLPTTCPAL